MYCKVCHGTREWCEHCGGSGIEPKPAPALTHEEIIKDFFLAAKGDISRFEQLVTKRFGSSIIETAMNLWNQRTPQVV